jgi:putative salt-induced outer membrane protein YdiY
MDITRLVGVKTAMARWSVCSLVIVAVFIASSAQAQAAPSGLMKQSAASGGSTEVATSGFEASGARDEAKKNDATEAKVLAGGLAASGNSRSIAATGSVQARLRRAANQGTAAAAVNFGRSPEDPKDRTSDMRTAIENYQAKIRYDRFLTERFTVFGALSLRRDRFQSLDLRLNIDPGVAYYFVTEPKQQLWGELGYDFQYDVRTKAAVDAAAEAAEEDPDKKKLDKTEVRHSGRLFVGYSNNLTEQVGVLTGLEYLQGIPETTNWRLNWDLGLTSKIAGNFSLAVTFSLKYDHNPLPNVAHTDTSTSVSLVYQLI